MAAEAGRAHENGPTISARYTALPLPRLSLAIAEAYRGNLDAARTAYAEAERLVYLWNSQQ